MPRANIRYTELSGGRWVIEAINPMTLNGIRSSMQFTDDNGQAHQITELFEPEGNPEAPYYFFVGVLVRQHNSDLI